MRQPVTDGALAAAPYAQLALPVAVRIGGIDAQLQYAGAAPALIMGVLQINAVVPGGVTPGGSVPIQFSIGNATSPAGVTLAVR